ncbi:hypothetical protein BU204_33945 [Actinophytocola xanthii]|uniref:Uncharacterized protein n=1 Tax=Actinophytocola xanthii TaxID=1912961 RepID=A0A1Q8C2R3_9PSEU|nr:hypothetical protein BU204_33945 [Actinophytocola xanthii]
MPYPPGARSGDRPTTVKPCPTCGELLGRGYPACLGCASAVDHLWLADWLELRTAERVSAGEEQDRALAVRVLSAPVGTYPWTCTDWALRLTLCAECGGELGAGPPVCPRCAAADSARWEWDHTATPAAMSSAEHALRVAVAVLRAPHRRREAVGSTWRLALPFLLAGETVTPAQVRELRTRVLAGRYGDLARLDTVAELVTLPLAPWRRWS